MTAANSGSETTSKQDSYAFDFEALFGPSSFIGKHLKKIDSKVPHNHLQVMS